MKGASNIKYSGNLRIHWNWSLYLAFTLFGLTIGVFIVDARAGLITLAFSVCYILIIIFIYLHYRPGILRALVQFADKYGVVQSQILKRMEISIAIVDTAGKVLWMNDKLCEATEKNEKFHGNISSLFSVLTKGVFPNKKEDKDIDFTYRDKALRAHIQRISIEGTIENSDFVEFSGKTAQEARCFYIIYLTDETEMVSLRRENREQKSAVALAYIDNYEEAMDNVDEVHSSLMNVLMDREINKYFSAHSCLSKKLEKDKYLVILNQKSLDDVVRDHFSILKEVKTVNIGSSAALTVSVGVGVGGSDYNKNYEFARSAIEMALGRGGDQAVVNRAGQMTFYGGKTQSGERHTRVKARVKAQAMREIMDTTSKVIAMGHKLTDMDSLGAAIGVYRAAKTLGKEAWIVTGNDSPSIKIWVKMLRESRDYEEKIFVSHERAKELCDDNTTLVVVDTNRPSMVECEELLSRTQTIVVLDHHRQTTEQIQNASLSYIEPSASSACEMVAEILQYFEENVKLKSLEADCLYAGIIIDTNNFSAKTGARTFEAAAYLRRCGAGITRVRKALRDDMYSYKARAEAVRHAEMFMGCYAISVLPGEGLEMPNVIAAQAANELLNIIGVKASFVATKYDGRVFISARAIDEVNVQLIMEKLGGGGHISIAGVQLQGLTCEEAVQTLKDTLTSMNEEGEM